MAQKSIQDILGYVPLTSMVRSTKTGIPYVLPEGFRSLTKNVVGDKSRYMQRTGQRRTARQTVYGADARNTELKEISVKDAALIHFYESIRLPMLTYQTLRQPESYEMQDLAQQEVDEQTAQFGARFDNLEIAALTMVLATGKLYFDAGGNLLPSSSGATLSVDFGVPSGNQGQLDTLGTSTPVIAASWATASTDIALHLRTLKQRAVQAHGYEPTVAIYGKNIPTYFQNNTTLNPYFIRHEGFRERLVTSNEIPRGMLDFDWYPGWKAFYEDQNGSPQTIIGDDEIIFCPEPSRDWWEVQLGSYLVPTTFDIVGEGSAARNAFKMVFGKFGYGQPVRNPVTADVYYGHTFLHIPKNPNVLYQADVTP